MSKPLIELFFELLFAENQKINLVSRKMLPSELRQRALSDANVLANLISGFDRTILDIGSGGGLPVVLLSIMLPGTVFTAVEANGKKTRFLEKIQKELDLKNLKIINARVESLKGQFSVGTARAVAHVAILLEYFSPLIELGGELFLPKGALGKQEQFQAKNVSRLCGFEFLEFIPNGEQGVILHYRKTRQSAILLPRKVGEAKRSPLS